MGNGSGKALALGLALFFASIGISNDCRRQLEIVGDPRDMVSGWYGSEYFILHGDYYDEFFLVADVVDGALEFSIWAVNADRNQRIFWRPKEAFLEMMRHYGPAVKIIRARWSIEDKSDNIYQLNASTQDASRPLVEAVFDTWTGKQARALGYHVPRVTRVEGNSGAYTWVVVEFSPR